MKVLIAEDSDITRAVVEGFLKSWDYETITVSDGEQAWQALQGPHAPRMAILDWEMPGLDGIEICRRLQYRKGASLVYTILLTAKTEPNDKLNGLKAGAHDFISKPFDEADLRSRLSVGERILEYDVALQEKNIQLKIYATEMESLAEARAQQLVHADRLAALGVMSAGVASEINNPTSLISGNIQTMEKFWPDIEKAILASMEREESNKERYEFILEEAPALLKGVRTGAMRIAGIANGLKGYCRQDSGEAVGCDVNECVSEALELCASALKNHVDVDQSTGAPLPLIKAVPQQIVQVFVNLFINAADAMNARERGRLRVETSISEGKIKIVVQDSGPGIPEDLLRNIWDPFFTTKGPGQGTGLGLPITQRIIENHEGTISVRNISGGGAQFTIAFPIEKPEKSPSPEAPRHEHAPVEKAVS